MSALTTISTTMDLLPRLPWQFRAFPDGGTIAYALFQNAPIRALVAIEHTTVPPLTMFLGAVESARVYVLEGACAISSRNQTLTFRPGEVASIDSDQIFHVETFCLVIYEEVAATS
ncbi:MAG: hypothetical protein HY369_01345 [Candidatus Aenigmarchaeota archaeon]|nr:hypothetical protein [Candidatus Aenigmarchaeota archaeon]